MLHRSQTERNVSHMETTLTRDFHIGDVLSAATGTLVSPRHIEGVYDILGWMTGDAMLMTHQLPRASRECEPSLRAQHADLCAVEIPGTINSMESAIAFLETLYPRFGVTVPVAPLAADDHTRIDPISEIKMIRPDLPIVGITVVDDHPDHG